MTTHVTTSDDNPKDDKPQMTIPDENPDDNPDDNPR
jgi:hypothetical protein